MDTIMIEAMTHKDVAYTLLAWAAYLTACALITSWWRARP